jgi:cyclophilin family peptidyl-prolyl cis-trans isomerase
MPDETDPAGRDAQPAEADVPAEPAAEPADADPADTVAAGRTDESTDDVGAGPTKDSVGEPTKDGVNEPTESVASGRDAARTPPIVTTPIIVTASGVPLVPGVSGTGAPGVANMWTTLPPVLPRPRDAASPTADDSTSTDTESNGSALGPDGDPDLGDDGADDADSRGRAEGMSGTRRPSRPAGDGVEDVDPTGTDDFDANDLDEYFDDEDENDDDLEDEDDEDDDDADEDRSPAWQRDVSAVRPRRRQISPEARVAVFGVLAALLLSIFGVILAKTLGSSSSSNDAATITAPTAAPAATSKVGDCVYTANGDTPARPVKLPPAASSVDKAPATMVITTNLGSMTATLDAAKAPCTVHALKYLADAKYFDGTACHRETHGADAGIFVLQCGDPTGGGSGTPGFGYANENTTGAKYNRGVLAMANAGPDTNGSQFFINYADPSAEGAAALAGGYTVFGQITQGLDVLDKITGPGVVNGGGDGAPASKPVITSVKITQ